MAKRGRPRRIQPQKSTPLRGDGGADSVSQGQARVADVLEDLDGAALFENVVGCGGTMMAWRKKDVPGEVIGPGMKERLNGRLGMGSSQNVASSSTMQQGVIVRTKIDGEWQEVVGKKLGMGVGVRKGLGTDLAGETGSRFDVLQHQTEDLVAVAAALGSKLGCRLLIVDWLNDGPIFICHERLAAFMLLLCASLRVGFFRSAMVDAHNGPLQWADILGCVLGS
ncbi:hypothetical protein Dimus_037008 [Dionaea muscipula]